MEEASKRRILIASEHAGLQLKEELCSQLRQCYDITETGAVSSEPIDYPPIAMEAAERVVRGEFDVGILICGTGIGMSIAAGKVPGARVALCTNEYMAQMSRRHNDANILCLGAWITGTRLSLAIAESFLHGAFEAGRHARRVQEIDLLARKYYQ